MKKVTVFFILLAVMLAGGITAYTVQKITSDNKQGSVAFLDYTKDVPVQFTSYTKESYPDLTYAAENAVQAVVSIEKVSMSNRRSSNDMEDMLERWFFGTPRGGQGGSVPREVRSSGSGVIISSDGYIVSNNHVVENATELKVTLNDKRTFTAQLVGTDPSTDLALLKIDEEGLPFLPFGSSENLRLGEWVLAIGTPFSLQSTVTAGIVSAKARNLGIIENMGIESFIQTDAAVNPGNSGGALVNTAGELVGINTLIKTETGSFIGYSFAVPSSIVKRVIVDLKEYGVFQRAFLGITMSEINGRFIENFGEEYGIKEIGEGGVFIVETDPNGGAHEAGIRKGDIVTELDGVKITSSAQIQELVAQHRPGDNLKVSVKREGKMKHFDVVLRNRAGRTEIIKADDVNLNVDLGGKFEEINDKIKKELKIEHGIRVKSVTGGILEKAGVKQGYIITHINDTPIRSVSDLYKITSEVQSIDGVYPDGRFSRYAAIR
ncbi:MAG: trypsin-like peptidase domain-containing protein [Rikenellaceae bacterium]|nr:trypsin-like peptidase domain-containing protein [Rikenellaceae bacterium]